MLNISPILLENSVPAKYEENLNQPNLPLAEVVNITTSCNSLPHFFPSFFLLHTYLLRVGIILKIILHFNFFLKKFSQT